MGEKQKWRHVHSTSFQASLHIPFPPGKQWSEASPNFPHQNKGFINYFFCRNLAVRNPAGTRLDSSLAIKQVGAVPVCTAPRSEKIDVQREKENVCCCCWLSCLQTSIYKGTVLEGKATAKNRSIFKKKHIFFLNLYFLEGVDFYLLQRVSEEALVFLAKTS